MNVFICTFSNIHPIVIRTVNFLATRGSPMNPGEYDLYATAAYYTRDFFCVELITKHKCNN